MNQMIWYVVITELNWSIIGGRRLVNEISDDVKSGSVAYKITKPYSYIGYFLSQHLGRIIIKGIIYVIIGLVIGLAESVILFVQSSSKKKPILYFS